MRKRWRKLLLHSDVVDLFFFLSLEPVTLITHITSLSRQKKIFLKTIIIFQTKSDQAGHLQGQFVKWTDHGQGRNMNVIVMFMANTEIHAEEVPCVDA